MERARARGHRLSPLGSYTSEPHRISHPGAGP
jgi:hypothetical protein